MPSLLSTLLSTSFIPHGHCYLWKPSLVWLHLSTDAVTAMAYYSVAIALVYFAKQRQDLPSKTVALLVGYFFVFALCGTTHLMGVVTLWYPIYWVSGLLKVINAIWSTYAFTFLLIPLIPVAIDMPSPAQLALTNQELETSRSRIQAINVELEQRVAERTAQLEASNRTKDELLVREQVIRTEAQAANRAKDEFLSILSHELRTPLNAILGWAQMLRQKQMTEETIERALETIERNARSQSKLIEDILDLSRIITGKMRLQVQPVNLIAVIESAMSSVQLAAEAKAIYLKSTFDPTVTLIMGDADRLQQVVWNLLSNAIKFTPTGGRVEVKLEVREAEGSRDAEAAKGAGEARGAKEDLSVASLASSTSTASHVLSYAQITVSDTGAGINPDFLPYVFDRFRQYDSSITRSFGGLGLGLALVRQLVELHGGTVTAYSPGADKGTTFTIKLPMILPQASLADSPLSNSLKSATDDRAMLPTLAGLQILIVEDEADALTLLSTILQEYGAEVRKATSVHEALALLETAEGQTPDVLVSDIGMPEEDGYSLIRRLRQWEAQRGGHLPAIALTAYASNNDRQQALLAGFQAHLPKPLEAAALVTMVASLMGRTERV